MKLKYKYLMLFLFLSSNSLFSQSTSDEEIVISVIYTYAHILDLSMSQENQSEFLYLMKYYGTNIESGVEKFISSQKLIFDVEDMSNGKKVAGFTRAEVDKLLGYVKIFIDDDYFKNIFYLAVAWNLCDYQVMHYDFSLSLRNSANDLAKLNEYKSARNAIEIRANTLTISSPKRRFLLSFFDRRTYTRLGF